MLFSSDGPSHVHHPVYTVASSYALHDFKGGPNRTRYQQTNRRTPSTFAFLIHRLMRIQIRAISCHLYKFSTNFSKSRIFFYDTIGAEEGVGEVLETTRSGVLGSANKFSYFSTSSTQSMGIGAKGSIGWYSFLCLSILSFLEKNFPHKSHLNLIP